MTNSVICPYLSRCPVRICPCEMSFSVLFNRIFS
nr:MAG TPA: hypothetical protein [Caudoviricetes sp.]